VPSEIAELAERVLRSLNMWRLPVDPFAIAEQEGILLKPNSYSAGFDARIEYYPTYNRFCIFYNEPFAWRTQGRVRFSIGHELGHYYIDEHQQRLRSGNVHDSISDYCSRDETECQADEFAAELLMPMALFRPELDHFHNGFCTLDDLALLASRLGTSITSTARRYCQSDREPCTIFFSTNGLIRWGNWSDDMKSRYMYFYPYNTAPPRGSKTGLLWDKIKQGEPVDNIEGTVNAHLWFERPRANYLWEEARTLGATGRIITQLTPES
jgi:Zn-dependent peptidase ImmA (M78 family)